MKTMIEYYPEQLGLVVNQWASFVPDRQAGTTKGESSSVASGLIEYGDRGTATNAHIMTCSQRGFKAGQSVVDSRAADSLFKLVALDPSQVSLRSVDPTTGSYSDKKIITLDYPEFLGHYQIKQQVEMLEGYPANTIFGSAALRSSWAAADCVSFMKSLIQKHGEPTVNVRMKPGRGVFAGAAYKPKAMTIVPACLQISRTSVART